MQTPGTTIGIGAGHDTAALAAAYARRGRVRVRNFLAADAAMQLHDALASQPKWNLVYRAAGKHVDSDAAAVRKWPADKRRKLEKLVHAGAVDGFQYCYANVPVYDIYHRKSLPGHIFNALVEFLNGAEFLDFVRGVTGDSAISFADAQATRYDAGHFLTCHDDEVEGKNRRVAYVLGLTPLWRPDWGGALAFVDGEGDVAEAFTPAFNALSLFRVPTKHMVGIVAPFAAASRFSITGWLRSGEDPER